MLEPIMSEHTEEPWPWPRLDYDELRAFLCVNACKGYSNEELEGTYICGRPLRTAMAEMKEECGRNARQRDELLAALKQARMALAAASTRAPEFNADYEAANIAVARAEDSK